MDPVKDSTTATGGDSTPPADLEETLRAHAAWLASDGRSGRRADLTDADLTGAPLAGRDLTRAVLSGADLSGADLTETVLDRAKMHRVRLREADLLGASLVEADLTWADLGGARLNAADLAGACLADADLTRARLKGADFSNADLEGADLRGAELSGTVMTGTDLTGTLFDAPAEDGRLDDAYEADDVLEGDHGAVAVSELPDADLEDRHHGDEAVAPAAAVAHDTRPPRGPEGALAEALVEHRAWLESGGRRGARLTLDGFDLAGLSLRGADLRRADLTRAVNLTPAHLGGADLEGAVLPDAVARFDALERAAALALRARRLLAGVVAACLYAVLALAAGPFPIAGATAVRLPALGTALPVPWFALGTPLLLLALYVWLHLYLQRMWEALAELPAVFPDGTPLDRRCDPWPVAGLARGHVGRLAGHAPPLWGLQNGLAQLLAWGAVPATLAFLWGAFVLWVAPAVSVFHALAAAAGFGFGLHTRLLARRTLRAGPPPWQSGR
jgi:uncharacterized protein YjbI with pentapeptide repeats